MKRLNKIIAFVLLLFGIFFQVAWGNQCNFDASQHSYHCRLRTLQDGLEADSKAASAKKLKVKCSDLFFSESRLRSRHFGELPSLEELDVEFCKIRQLPAQSFSGLSNLRRLSLQSHNSERGSGMMEVHVHSLRNLDKIEELNLSHNNLWSLPSGVLCDLPKLREVNFSRNHLLDVSDLSLSGADGCQAILVVLDLSHNYITSLKTEDLNHAPALLMLNLNNNQISILGDSALSGLKSLQVLNLANNQLAAIPPLLFNSSQELQKLSLQNNSLTLLPPGVFTGLNNLAALNLSKNAISSHLLSEDTFSGLDSLQILDLSHNQLLKIEGSAFQHLKQLQILHLHHNKIHTVSANSFLRQASLKTLILSNNKIDNFADNAFDGLISLSTLSLDHNELRALPDNIFRQTPKLEDLSIDNNQLTEIPKSISAFLYRLRTLDLGENKISELKVNDFNSLLALYGLRLSGNRLTLISKDQFTNNTQLHVLNLARNKLSKIEQGSFDNLKNLRALRLDNNELADINGIVSALTHLQWFNVSSNQLQWFDYAFVPMSLEWLDLHDNHIEELGNYYKLKSGFQLKTLDASANKIKKLSKLSLPSSLETIVLSRNDIRGLEPKLFEDKPNLTRVELAANQIKHLDLDSLYIGKVETQEGNCFLSSSRRRRRKLVFTFLERKRER